MQTFVRNEQDDGIGPHQQMSLETYDDDSTCDVQLARRAVYPLARAWAFAHCDLAPHFG